MSDTGWTLWGFNPAYGPHPIKITAGTLAEVNAEHTRRTREGGWELGIRRVGHARPWFDGVDGRP